jgi:hypothetical protein
MKPIESKLSCREDYNGRSLLTGDRKGPICNQYLTDVLHDCDLAQCHMGRAVLGAVNCCSS